MIDKSELIVKSVDKIVFVEMAMLLVVALLTQIRNIAEHKLKSEVKLKTNEARLDKVFTKRQISTT